MHPADIKAALEKKDITQIQIAKDLGVTSQSICLVIKKRTISDRIMKTISRAIGVDNRQVFPEYYLKPSKRRTSNVATV